MLTLLCQPACAETVNKCKLDMLAHLPVVMQGNRVTVAASVNGKETRLSLDSGAFFNFMPKAKAVELGLTTEPVPVAMRMTGIGGSFTPELTRVRDFGLVGGTFHNMEFVVGGSDDGNAFLGANLLGAMDTEFDLAKGSVNLFKEKACSNTALAYWGKGMTVGAARLFPSGENDRHIIVEVIVNGHSLHAMLDSGATHSIIGRHAAERAGIDLSDPKVVASYKESGIGAHQRASWIARTKTISIGGEQISNSPIRVIDDAGDQWGADMLLGVDFLMAHHVLTSPGQHLMFLTYNGGPIFSATTDHEIGHLDTRSEGMGEAEKAADPKTADAFAGRGSARLNRGDAPGAIADFSAAIQLAPKRADLLADRAQAYRRNKQADLAIRDVDAALALDPHDHRLLVVRAWVKLAKGDKASALVATDAAAADTPPGSLDVMAVVTLYERLGMADRGLRLIDPVIALHRDDLSYTVLLNARSWNRALANADLDQALKDINLAIRRSGPLPGILDTRALIELRRRDYTATIADENTALAKAPQMAAGFFTRGMARIAAGDAATGAEDIAEARKLQPNIERRYAPYGLVVPEAAAGKVPSPADNVSDDDSLEDGDQQPWSERPPGE